MSGQLPKQIVYVLEPHPDDLMQAYALLQRSLDNYYVFAVLTHGERTGFCDGSAFNPGAGERKPAGGFTGPLTDGCHTARLDSWHAWMDTLAAIDRGNLDRLGGMNSLGRLTHEVLAGDEPPVNRNYLASDGSVPPGCPPPGNQGACAGDRPAPHADWWVGPKSARVVFNLGNGDLTRGEVTWVIQTLRRNRGLLPVNLPEYGVVGASYYNSAAGCYVYTHSDHRAVHEALWLVDQGAGRQWAATCYRDPDASIFRTVDSGIWHANMDATATSRPGAFQQIFGWLWPGYWPTSTGRNDQLFTQQQAFWRRF